MTGQLAEDGMAKAMTDRIEQQVRQAFPVSAIARVQILQDGDDPEVEPGQAAVRVFFNWPGQAEGGQASSKTVHQFCTANAAALGVLRDQLPDVIGWAELPQRHRRLPLPAPVLALMPLLLRCHHGIADQHPVHRRPRRRAAGLPLRHLERDPPGTPPRMRPAQLAHQRLDLRRQPRR